MSSIQNTINFLKENPENFIWITNLNNDTRIGQNVHYKDIPNEDLEQYILSLNPSTKTRAWIEHRKKQGNTNVKVRGMGYTIKFDAESDKPQNLPVATSSNHLPTNQAIPQHYSYPTINPNPIDYGALGSPFGLSAPETRDMVRKADKYEAMKETLEERTEELRKIKQDFDLQEIENRELKSKLAVSEQEKTMAITLAKMENKSFLDSPAFEKLIEKAPEVFANMVAMKSGQVPTTTALNSPLNNLSDVKRDFVDYISANEVSDQDVNFVGATLNFMGNDQFKAELQQLITKYNI
ncbi:hypothetical protein GOQ30_11330 [Flavobacterium sp. TP390]|uniref:Uncharacterized protein n=1 Tax=Flavobacterium profundi TaxID=1774945 RepID=A0A6I4IJ27_9FLAO|nr:hypothetical protein [Flavobacterium profundi]MVO09750.1 hypothetical protein [Flavobacterium profundi]